MNCLEDFREWLTNCWRPYHSSCLPEELAFPDDTQTSILESTKMLRDARFGSSCDLELGVFEILGLQEAKRAACIWSPITRLITEEVSIAFRFVDKQRQTGEIVSGHNIARLTETLYAYFSNIGRQRTRESIRIQIDEFLKDRSLADADAISPVRLPVRVEVPLLEKLKLLEQEVRVRFVDRHGRPENLDCVGLIFDEKLDDHRYDHSTPLNCRTFAGTGGNGAHFSFLVQDGEITESSPIVVTDPSGMASVVIAGSLHEFLCLGCEKGYFSIGHSAYAPIEFLADYVGPENAKPVSDYLIHETQHKVLALLRERLDLTPWNDITKFLDSNARFGPLLRYPPDTL